MTKPDWTNRRIVILNTLRLCGLLSTTIIAVACYTVIAGKPVDRNASDILSGALYALAGLLGSIIGSYVFGAAWEARSLTKEADGK